MSSTGAGMLLCLVAIGVPGAGAASAEPAKAGKSLYQQHCARCHGFNMVSSGAVAPDLRIFPLTEHPRFVTTVRDGKGAMPAWKDMLSPAEIEALWSYVSNARAAN